MCCAKDWISESPTSTHCNGQQKQQPSRRYRVRVHRLIISRKGCEGTKTGKELELKNMKLYLENRSILEENEKLRQRALRLRQENLALITEFQKKFKFCKLGGSNLIN